MNKIVLVTAMFICSIAAINAQPGTPPPPPAPYPKQEGHPKRDGEKKSERKEKIEAMKIGYLTKQLDLTSEEAQKFWPVYNEYTKKEHEMRKAHRMKVKQSGKALDEMSDKEVEAIVDDEIIFRQKQLDLEKEYHKQFKSVLPARKVAKLYRAEEMFKRELVRKIQEKND